MAAKDTEASDKNKNVVQTGSIVIYPETGTTGTIVEIVKDKDGTWALIDTTGLFYRTDILEKIDELPEKEKEKKILKKDIKEKLDIQKEAVQAFTIDNVGEPGGAG